MPYRDKEDKPNYNKKYYEANKEILIAKSKKYREDNKEIVAIRNKKWYEDNKEDNKEKTRGIRVRRAFNITLEEYDTYFERGTCAICLSSDRKLVLDHCHYTGKN